MTCTSMDVSCSFRFRYLVLNEDASKAGIHESLHGTLYIQSIAKTGVSISNHWKCLSRLQAIPAVPSD